MMEKLLLQCIEENLHTYVAVGMDIGFVLMALLCLLGYVVGRVQDLV
ncbi:MAG: hypothetical protein J6A08_00185 [Lachnospiraceae bacterium]|nr:hypothetical protein [Lachnospiraceae bacterium]